VAHSCWDNVANAVADACGVSPRIVRGTERYLVVAELSSKISWALGTSLDLAGYGQRNSALRKELKGLAEAIVDRLAW